MKKEKLNQILAITEKFTDLLFDTEKTDIFSATKTDSVDDMLPCVHYTIESPELNTHRVFKDYRVTINNANVCANKVLFSESLREKYKVNACFEKSVAKNYFFISYKTLDDLNAIITELRNNYYEHIVSTSFELSIPFTFSEKASATKKRRKKASNE